MYDYRKRVFKIVLTGAPCGGKTACMGYIGEFFEKMGYRVIRVNETATELYNVGLTLGNDQEKMLFNRAFIDLQMYKENIYTNIAYGLKDEKVIILFDRGILDAAVFMGYQSFEDYLIGQGKDINMLLSGYNAVIHLHTAAEYSFDVYDRNANLARKEGAGQAFSMDKQYSELWNKFYEVKEVDACESFEDKIEKIKHIILDIVNDHGVSQKTGW